MYIFKQGMYDFVHWGIEFRAQFEGMPAEKGINA